MTRNQTGSLLVGLAAAGFFATAAIHSTGYDSVTALAAKGPADLQALMPALWLVFSFDLTVVGLILGVVAFRPARSSRLIVAMAALCPLGSAALQIRYIGFVLPTAILLGLSALTFIAACVNPSTPDSIKEADARCGQAPRSRRGSIEEPSSSSSGTSTDQGIRTP